jgi:hypothetical protein
MVSALTVKKVGCVIGLFPKRLRAGVKPDLKKQGAQAGSRQLLSASTGQNAVLTPKLNSRVSSHGACDTGIA